MILGSTSNEKKKKKKVISTARMGLRYLWLQESVSFLMRLHRQQLYREVCSVGVRGGGQCLSCAPPVSTAGFGVHNLPRRGTPFVS